LSALSQDATRGFTDIRESIINRTRSLSLNTKPVLETEGVASSSEGDKSATPTTAKAPGADEETYLSRLRSEAAKRLKDIQKAEDAADEALLKFGSNIRDFLREAITIAPPSGSSSEGQGSTVLFESKDASGKRVIHTSRFDAQLHVIHTNPQSFTEDPAGEEYGSWSKGFEIDKRTEDISGDLAKYPELRATMEKLVPQQIPYADFWRRYYFLRHSIETAEARRRDLLKGLHFLPLLLVTQRLNCLQLHPPRRMSHGTRTLTTKARQRRPRRQRKPPLLPRPQHSIPLPTTGTSSQPSPEDRMTRSRKPTAKPATTSSVQHPVIRARRPAKRRTVPANHARARRAMRRTGSRSEESFLRLLAGVGVPRASYFYIV
jgi:hypothetical protein